MAFFRRIWPKYQLSDKVAFSFTHFGLVGISLFQLFVVLPIYHEPNTAMYIFHILAGLFIFIQVFTNMYSMILSNSTVRSSSMNLPSVLRPGWYYCHVCQMNSPPRSHHCPVCEVCVIKRDHHCVFTGNCVGFQNHRYFMLMVLYLWIGCVYVILFNLDYYFNVLGHPSFTLILKLIFPGLAWTLGYVTMFELSILIVSGVNCMAMFLFTCLLGFQFFFITRGQTQFECKKKIREYTLSFSENWKIVLGEKWYLTMLSAYINSKLPGDGTDFKKSMIDMSPVSESVKTM